MFASHEYSAEELVAEMTAAMLAGHAGIATAELDENAAAYLDHWLKVLKAEPELLVTAGGSAQKAADRIMGVTWGESDSD
jgi:antirestriction protein ArdC